MQIVGTRCMHVISTITDDNDDSGCATVSARICRVQSTQWKRFVWRVCGGEETESHFLFRLFIVLWRDAFFSSLPLPKWRWRRRRWRGTWTKGERKKTTATDSTSTIHLLLQARSNIVFPFSPSTCCLPMASSLFPFIFLTQYSHRTLAWLPRCFTARHAIHLLEHRLSVDWIALVMSTDVDLTTPPRSRTLGWSFQKNNSRELRVFIFECKFWKIIVNDLVEAFWVKSFTLKVAENQWKTRSSRHHQRWALLPNEFPHLSLAPQNTTNQSTSPCHYEATTKMWLVIKDNLLAANEFIISFLLADGWHCVPYK